MELIEIELFRIFGSLVIEDKAAIKSLKEADKEARNNNRSLNEVNRSLENVAKAVIAAFSVKAIINFSKKIVEASASLGEMDAQFEQVFRDSHSEALSKLSDQSKELGWHTDRLKDSWNKFGGQFLGVGQDSQTAMDMTTRATARAADASAFYDVTLGSATESLQSLLKGNFSAGGAIGVYTSAAEMGEVATKKWGLKWADLTQAQRQSLILEKVEETYALNGAMDHAIRESDQWANTTANLEATMTRFYATVGEPVLEAFTVIVNKLTDAVEWATENLDILIPVLAGVLGLFGAMFIISTINKLTSAYAAANTTLTIAQWALNAAMAANPFSWLAVLIGALIAAGVALYMNWDKVKQTAINLYTSIKQTFNNIGSTIKNIMTSASNTVKGAIDKIKGFLNFKWAFPKLKLPHFSIKGSVNPLKWLSEGVPKIGVEWYKKGGIMTKPTAFGFNGKNVLAGGEADNEAVLPLNEKNLGAIGRGIAKTMNSSGGIDYEKLSDTIVYAFGLLLDGLGLNVDGRQFARLVLETNKRGY